MKDLGHWGVVGHGQEGGTESEALKCSRVDGYRQEARPLEAVEVLPSTKQGLRDDLSPFKASPRSPSSPAPPKRMGGGRWCPPTKTKQICSPRVEGGRRDEGRRGSRLQPLPCSCRDEKAAEEICRQLPSGRGWASTRGTEERLWASAKAFQRTREQLLLGGKSCLIWILFLKHRKVFKRRVLLNQLGIQMLRISSARWTT